MNGSGFSSSGCEHDSHLARHAGEKRREPTRHRHGLEPRSSAGASPSRARRGVKESAQSQSPPQRSDRGSRAPSGLLNTTRPGAGMRTWPEEPAPHRIVRREQDGGAPAPQVPQRSTKREVRLRIGSDREARRAAGPRDIPSPRVSRRRDARRDRAAGPSVRDVATTSCILPGISAPFGDPQSCP